MTTAIADPKLTEIVRRLVDAYQPERRRSRLAYMALRGTGTAADVLVCTLGYFESRLHLKASLPATVAREGRLLFAA